MKDSSIISVHEITFLNANSWWKYL